MILEYQNFQILKEIPPHISKLEVLAKKELIQNRKNGTEHWDYHYDLEDALEEIALEHFSPNDLLCEGVLNVSKEQKINGVSMYAKFVEL